MNAELTKYRGKDSTHESTWNLVLWRQESSQGSMKPRDSLILEPPCLAFPSTMRILSLGTGFHPKQSFPPLCEWWGYH